MTWTPRNRSEDEEEEENIDLEKNDEDEPQKLEEKGDPGTPDTGREQRIRPDDRAFRSALGLARCGAAGRWRDGLAPQAGSWGGKSRRAALRACRRQVQTGKAQWVGGFGDAR